jgi:TRAP-type mannitol/chloroaromatic compound transport system substrate-binding protein
LKELPNNGVELVEFSSEILQAAQKETEKLLNLYARIDTPFKEIYDEWRNFKKQIRSWSKLNHID